jgi:hypothetical protein
MNTPTRQRISIALAILIAAAANGTYAQSSQKGKVKETLTDRCSTSVRIVPSLIYSPNNATMVEGSKDPIRLDRNSPAAQSFSTPRSVGLLSDGYFKWFCGTNADQKGGTQEKSRCPQGTNALAARLGPDRLLSIQCWSDLP